MTRVQSLLIDLMRFCLTGAPLDDAVRASIDEELLQELYELAEKQSLTHLAAHALEQQGLLADRGEIGAQFRNRMMFSIMQYGVQKGELAQLCRLFEEEKIPFVTLKGSVLREFYPQPWMRTSVDIDILVKPEYVEAASALLTDRFGCTAGRVGNYDLTFYTPRKVSIELHHRLYYTVSTISDAFIGVLERVWDYARPAEGWEYRYDLTDEMFYFYNVVHMAKHFRNGGCGIRLFMDLWLLNRRADYPKELLRECDLGTFTEAASTLADRWMTGEPLDELSSAMADYVLGAGIYGLTSNRVTSRMVSQGKRQYYLRLIFPSYAFLCMYYPRLEGRKYLLPYYTVKRWFRLLFTTRNVKETMKLRAPHIEDERLLKMKRLMDDLELLPPDIKKD